MTNIKDLLQSIYGSNIYSSGAITKGDNQQQFAIIALDMSSYQSSISQYDLLYFMTGFQANFEYNYSSATLLEESSTSIDGQSAIKSSYEFGYDPRSRLDIIATYKGLDFYLIFYGTEYAGDYNNNAGLFNDMKDSII